MQKNNFSSDARVGDMMERDRKRAVGVEKAGGRQLLPPYLSAILC
jgi:hypothetical protein